MSEFDQSIGKRFEGIMQLAETLETIQQAVQLVFPSEFTLNGAKSLVEYSLFVEELAVSFGLFSGTLIWVDIGSHAAIENGFAD